MNEPKVKAFIQWTKTLKDSVMLQKTAVGGHYSYPPAPPIFTPTTKTNTASKIYPPDIYVDFMSLIYLIMNLIYRLYYFLR